MCRILQCRSRCQPFLNSLGYSLCDEQTSDGRNFGSFQGARPVLPRRQFTGFVAYSAGLTAPDLCADEAEQFAPTAGIEPFPRQCMPAGYRPSARDVQTRTKGLAMSMR